MKTIVQTSGKRKTAVARATAREGSGRITINGYPIEFYPIEILKQKMLEPVLMASEVVSGIDIKVTVKGGGVSGQADAARTAIAKSIIEFLKHSKPEQAEILEDSYRKYDRTMLVSDVRIKLPKKPQGRGARAKRQKSYR